MRIGPLEPLDGPITLVEYDPAWPSLYARESARIRTTLGDRVLLLEHVGSTSVPHLAAKPRIDIVLAVADSSDEAGYFPPLEAAGYVLRIRERDWHEHRLFNSPDTEVNLHVFSAGCDEIQRLLLFRDHLRCDEPIVCGTSRRNATWRSGGGGTSSTTPTQRPPWSRRS